MHWFMKCPSILLKHFDSIQQEADRTLLHRFVFGPKIKMAHILLGKFEPFERSIGLLSNLREIIMEDCRNGDYSEYMRKLVYSILTNHHAMYPGVLNKVTYTIFPDSGGRCRSDPKIMLIARDILCDWLTNQLIFEISGELNQDWLTVLGDIDLPKQLRVVRLRCSTSNLEDHWVKPLRLFLSRCKQLDSINFVEFLPARILNWVLEKNNSHCEDIIVSGAMTRWDGRVLWKSISFDHFFTSTDSSILFKDMMELEEFWKILVSGFGHCVETLWFWESCRDAQSKGSFPILSLPASCHLPKLRSLQLRWPRFGQLGFSGIDRLKKLMLELNGFQLNNNENGWQDWKQLSGVEDLELRIESSELGIDIFNCGKSETSSWKSDEQKQSSLPSPPPLTSTSISPFLKKLKTVRISDHCIIKLNPNVLLYGPNITYLRIFQCGGDARANLTASQLMNWSWFLEQVVFHSLSFPNLKSLEAESPLTLDPDQLVKTLLGISCTSDGCTSGHKCYLFPSLTQLTLGPLFELTKSTSSDQLPEEVENSFVQAFDKSLRERLQGIPKQCKWGDRMLTFNRSKVSNGIANKWREMLCGHYQDDFMFCDLPTVGIEFQFSNYRSCNFDFS